MTTFAISVRDELWIHGALLESRISHGEARQDGHEIVARDAYDAALAALCDAETERLRATIAQLGDARVRSVARAVREDGVERREASLTITIRGISIVTVVEAAQRDAAMLRALAAVPPEIGRVPPLPVVWRSGSAAVLLHEAVGHAAEHGAPPIEWPSWLRVDDVPDDGSRRANLLEGPPRLLRRESFRDVPLPRMTRVVARQDGAPFDMPDEYVEVQLLAGGSYDRLGERVGLRVAVANLVTGGATRRLVPFDIHTTRAAVARALRGASGEPLRYPGVVCSSEGQELVVGSYAPVMITEAL